LTRRLESLPKRRGANIRRARKSARELQIPKIFSQMRRGSMLSPVNPHTTTFGVKS